MNIKSCKLNYSFDHIIHQWQQTSIWELSAFLFGVIQVLLASLNHRFNFFAGLVSVSIYIGLFFSAGLYAESLLNFYYLLMSILGLYLWRQTEVHSISFATNKENRVAVLLATSSFLLVYFLLITYTDSDVPLPDAAVSCLAWTGSWLLVRRKIENWLWLTASNIVAIPLHIYKGFELTSLLTMVYLIGGILGYFRWKKLYAKSRTASSNL